MAEFLHHEGCSECGSSDACAVYDDGSTYCFSCSHSTRGNKQTEKRSKVLSDIYYEGEYLAVQSRGLSLETAKHFKVKTDKHGNIVYPYFDHEGELVATKVRVAGKKEFRWTGEPKKATLFGMNTFGTNGKILTIVEGQDDAMAVFQITGSKWPVISIDSATSASKDIKGAIDFVESFEKVVICCDSDEPGRKASQTIAELLTPGKAHIVTLNRYKDANDYLKSGKQAEFQQEWWQSKKFTPVGIVSFNDVWDSVLLRKMTEIIPLPSSMPILASMLNGGLAKGEITTVGALTSIGKTTFVNNLLYGFLKETDNRVGYLGLETTVGELSSSLINLEAKSKVIDKEDLDKAKEVYDNIKWKDNLFIVDHQGSLELEDMIKKIRNTIIAFDLDIFILDPLQAALPDLNNDTVKYAMDSLLKLSKQTNVSIIIVSHMRKPDADKPHNVSEYDLLGSSSINQISFNTILLSRDKMGETDAIKSSTMIRLVKSRRTGKTGEAGWLRYVEESGLLEQGEDPYQDEFEGDEWK